MPGDNPLPKGVTREGNVETAYIEFDGLPLFKVASPMIADRTKPGTAVPVEVRAKQSEGEMKRVLEALLSEDHGNAGDDRTPLDSGAIRIEIQTARNQTVLAAHGKGLASPVNLLVVTPLDAEHLQKSPEDLAAEWRNSIRNALSTAVHSRRPEALRKRNELLRNLAIFVPCIHLLLFGVDRLFLRRQKYFRGEIVRQREAAAAPPADAADANAAPVSDRSTTREKQQVFFQALSLEKRFRLLALVRWLIFWLLLSLWVGGIGIALWLFPQTRRIALYMAATPLLVLVTVFVAGLVNRIADLLVEWFVAGWQSNQLFDSATAAHTQARVTTISGVIRTLKLVVVYGVAAGWVLSELEVVPWSLVTIGAIIALAVSFAAQSLVKDVVMGFLILVEDQFAVGDYIAVQDTTGTVENMNLRITQIRTWDGRLVTLPNSSIAKVENLSRSWALVSVEFDVPPTASADRVLECTRRIVREMAQEPEWKEVILDPDRWSGIDKLSRAGMTIEVAVKTKPMDQWNVGRELRRRIKNALDTEGIQSV